MSFACPRSEENSGTASARIPAGSDLRTANYPAPTRLDRCLADAAQLRDVREHRVTRRRAGMLAAAPNRQSRRMQHERPRRSWSVWTMPPYPPGNATASADVNRCVNRADRGSMSTQLR